MAWYALYKWFSPWRNTPYSNYIDWYKRYLHREWLLSLTPEEKEEYYKKQEKLKRERELAVRRLLMMPAMISSALERDARNLYGNNIR